MALYSFINSEKPPQLPKSHRSTYGYLVTLMSGFVAVIASNAAVLLLFFAAGDYHNYGVAGLSYAFGIIIAVFTLAGIIARTIINSFQMFNAYAS